MLEKTINIKDIRIVLGKEYGYGKLVELQKKLDLPHPRIENVKKYLEKNYNLTVKKELPPSGLSDSSESWQNYGSKDDDYKWIFEKKR
jgi:hypothetical protein